MERTLEHLHARYGTAREYLEDYAGCKYSLSTALPAKLRGEGL